MAEEEKDRTARNIENACREHPGTLDKHAKPVLFAILIDFQLTLLYGSVNQWQDCIVTSRSSFWWNGQTKKISGRSD